MTGNGSGGGNYCPSVAGEHKGFPYAQTGTFLDIDAGGILLDQPCRLEIARSYMETSHKRAARQTTGTKGHGISVFAQGSQLPRAEYTLAARRQHGRRARVDSIIEGPYYA